MQIKATHIAEKRAHARHNTKTRISVRAPGLAPIILRSTNLSAKGVFVHTEDLGLTPGTAVELTFVIELSGVIKLHRRRATVVHLHNGGTGFEMDSMQPK
jgi:hypothetical protein